jgi:PAS domain S-box-containing protein
MKTQNNAGIVAQIRELAKDDHAADSLLTLFETAFEREQVHADYANSIIDLQEQMICRYDAHGRLTFANLAFCESVGQRWEDVRGQRLETVINAGVPEEIALRREQLFTASVTIIHEVEVTDTDGRAQWQEWTQQSVVNAAGEIDEVQASIQDITANKLAQLITQRSMQQYRMLVQNMPGTTVLLFDADHRYLLAEGALVQQLTDDPRQIEGRTLRDVWDASVVQLAEPAYDAALAGVSTHKQAALDGQHFDMQFVPLPTTHEGERQGMVVIRNITDQRENEAALRESNARLSQIAANIDEVFFLYDVTTDTLLYVSPAFEKVWGLAPEVALNNYHRLFETIDPDDLKRVEALGTHSADLREPHELEFRIMHPTDGQRHIRLRITPVTEPHTAAADPPLRIVAVAKDITRHKQAETQALELTLERERMRVLTRFIDMAAHEFRTPLSVIGTQAYLMKMSDDPTSREQSASVIDTHVDNITYLLNRLVTMSKLDGAPDLSFYHTNLRTVVSDALAAISRRAEAAEVHVEHALGDERFPILADARLLGQAVREVLDNALHYTPAGGRITVQLAETADSIVVTITDTGSGMSEDVLQHAFQRFYRADKAQTTKGFGLGLPIARRIVEIHGGTLTAASAPGKGTVCTLALPHNLVRAATQR